MEKNWRIVQNCAFCLFFLSFSPSTQSMSSSVCACSLLCSCAVVSQPGGSSLLEDFVKISHRLGLSLPLFSFQPHPTLQIIWRMLSQLFDACLWASCLSVLLSVCSRVMAQHPLIYCMLLSTRLKINFIFFPFSCSIATLRSPFAVMCLIAVSSC